MDPLLEEKATRLYELAWEYYMYQVGCLTRENYAYMQTQVGYPETFEEHTKRLFQGIPDDTSRMVQQIKRFITEYVAFQDPKYCDRIAFLIERLRADPRRHQEAAMQALMAQFKDRDPEARVPEDLPAHPPLFETTIGAQQFVLPTYGNPMMTALYSLLFVCFERFQAEEAALDPPTE